MTHSSSPVLLLQRLTITVTEFTALTGLCKSTAHKMIRLKQLETVHACRRTLITTESVIRRLAPHLAAETWLHSGEIDRQAGEHPA